MSSESTGEGEFRHSFRERHDRGQRHGRCASDKDIGAKGHAPPHGCSLMHADPALNLIV